MNARAFVRRALHSQGTVKHFNSFDHAREAQASALDGRLQIKIDTIVAG